ncbi:hypothetical protein TNCT_297251 [Trichonephila clavata]|uniref:Uncharacterized protein n=1 Tax=Trichonephila clavata TaxID=2740835 RepID=A0A8X6JLU3_TRICU|nr:hypothetical protein TNCT_297251 [Trichonephila clavata]
MALKPSTPLEIYGSPGVVSVAPSLRQACGAHVSRLFTMPIAAKYWKIDFGITESLYPRSHTIDDDRTLTFCLK